MEIYLIRHGETGGNVARRHQAEKTPLTDRGREQAKEVAKKIEKYKPTHLLCSPMVRAVETARIIGDEIGMVPEINDNFVEIKRPDHLYGNHHISPVSVWFYIKWYFGKTDVGESYKELRDRIKAAKQYFKKYPEDARVAVVTHGVFINMFIAHLCDDKPLTPLGAFKTFKSIMKMKNTEIVPVIFDPNAGTGTCAWLNK